MPPIFNMDTKICVLIKRCRHTATSECMYCTFACTVSSYHAGSVPSRNRLSSHYINIATTRYNDHAGSAAQAIPKEKDTKRKREKQNAIIGSSTEKRRRVATAAPSRHVPPRSLHSGSPPYQATPPTRKVTTTPLLPGQVLGFPPVRGGGEEGGTPDALQEGRMAPAGVTASVPNEPARISPDPDQHHPERSKEPTQHVAHQHAPPRS
jgi:hypothetical protein